MARRPRRDRSPHTFRFGLQANEAEIKAWAAAAEAAGLDLGPWARGELIRAAESKADPPPLLTPARPVPGPRRRGRPAVSDEDRRDRQLRIRLTPEQREACEAARRAGRWSSLSAWARAVLWAVAPAGGAGGAGGAMA